MTWILFIARDARAGASPAPTAIIFCLVLFLGCRNPSQKTTLDTSSPPVYDDSFIESSIGDASYLNPVLSSDSASSDINSLVFSGLLMYDENIKMTGDLARDWKISDDGLVFTFYLKKNITWHDGKPFTTEDVLYTYERLKDPAVKTPRSSDYETVKKVEALDSHTLRVTYSEPFVPALESWTIGIIPKHIFGGAKGKEFNEHPANKKPIGTGPYIFKEWKVDEKIVLEANPDFHDDQPRIARYIYRIIPDKTVEFFELRNKSIDLMNLTPDQYFAYEEFFEGYQRFRYPSSGYTYIAFNLTHPLFKQKRIRQAVAHAINKPELVGAVLRGLGSQASGPYSPLSWAYYPDIKDWEYDLNLSRKILAEEGWVDTNGDGILELDGKPFEFKLITNQGNKKRFLCAQIIQQQLKKVGIKANIIIYEWSTFIKNFVDKRNFDAMILGWNLPVDPDQYSIWHSSQKKEGQFNFVSYNNPEVDKILVNGRREFNFKKRQKMYQRMHQIIHNDIPYIFLYYPDSLPVLHQRFEGLRKVPLSAYGIAWNFDKWFVRKKNVKYPVMEPGS